jgi:hypothetical protein
VHTEVGDATYGAWVRGCEGMTGSVVVVVGVDEQGQGVSDGRKWGVATRELALMREGVVMRG